MLDQTDKIKFWFLVFLTFLLSGLFAFINLFEFIKIGLLKLDSGYPFGAEGPVPWFYKTAELYAKVSLISGLLFLVTLLFSIWTAARKNRIGLFITFLATILLIVIQIVNSLN